MCPAGGRHAFHLAGMTVEVHQFRDGPVIGFNGTIEWALDSVELDDTLWLPREDQLRAALGSAFVGLALTSEGYAVTVTLGERERRVSHTDPEQAYGTALLAVLTR